MPVSVHGLMPSTVTGTDVTPPETVDDGPSPTRFVATTETAYDVPFERPDIEHDSGFGSLATEVEQVAPPGDKVTV